MYKEIARGSTRVADTDRQKSFPNAVRDRYPDLDAVAMWVDFPADFAAACGFNVEVPGDYKHVKSFCNSAAGSGRIFEEEWLRSANRSVLPEAMVLYRQQLRTAAERDVERRPEIAQSFRDQGFDEAAVRNKTHYVCNAEIERRECDAALARREGLASTIAFESDGHPCVVADESKIPGVLEAMNRGLEPRKQFVHKPYRSRADLVAHLQQQYPEIPPEAFAQVDSDWERKAQMTLEFRRRLIAGENPVLLSKHLVPDFLVGGRRVADQFRTVSGSKDCLDYFRFPSSQEKAFSHHSGSAQPHLRHPTAPHQHLTSTPSTPYLHPINTLLTPY